MSAGSAQAAFFTGLDPADDWYFLVVSRSNVLGAESAGVPIGPARAEAPAPLYQLSGVVDSSALSGHSPLIVFAMGENTFLGRVFTSATPVQNYSLGVPANGYYECGAFIDLVNPGAIDLLDPKTFGLVETASVSVSGADATAPAFVLPAGRALMGARSEHRLAGTEERYSVLLSVVPNEWLPLAATFDSSSDGLSGPIDFMRPRSGELALSVRYGSTVPTVGTSYGIHVFYENGVTCNLAAAVSAVLELPQNPAPVNVTVTDSTPTFSWDPPANLPPSYRYEIGVFGGNPSNQQLWGTRLQPGTSSIEYNANGEASMTTLANGDYTWTIQIVDANENKALVSSSFSVASP